MQLLALDFLESLLNLNPVSRPTALDMRTHRFLLLHNQIPNGQRKQQEIDHHHHQQKQQQQQQQQPQQQQQEQQQNNKKQKYKKLIREKIKTSSVNNNYDRKTVKRHQNSKDNGMVLPKLVPMLIILLKNTIFS